MGPSASTTPDAISATVSMMDSANGTASPMKADAFSVAASIARCISSGHWE